MSVFYNKKLCKKEQYDAVFANKKFLDSRLFKLFWKSNDCATARIGVSVAKRNVSKAVNRNKLKRLAKESFRLNSEFLPLIDIVLILKREAGVVSKEAYVLELNKKWQQLINLATQPVKTVNIETAA